MKPKDLIIGQEYRLVFTPENLGRWGDNWGTTLAYDLDHRTYKYDGYDCGEHWFIVPGSELYDVFEGGQLSFDEEDIECLHPLECMKSKEL